MLRFLSSIISYLFSSKNDDVDDDDSNQENFLAEQIIDLEIINDVKSNTVIDDLPNETTSPTCYQQTGTITYTGENYVLIDGILYFDTSNSSLNVNLNDIVCYLCYKKDNDIVKVVRILENLGPGWGENYQTEVDKYKVIEHVIISEVDYRQDRKVFMKESDLKFDLDGVESTFVPLQGDWLELMCTIQWDEKNPCDITAAQVVEVKKLKPLRSKAKVCTVTQWNNSTGICDGNIFFNKDVVQVGVELHVGSKVIVDAIESNQGYCSWRAIKIILDDTMSFTVPNKVKNNLEEQVTLKLEEELDMEMTYPLKFCKVGLKETASINLKITNNSNQQHTITKWIIVGKKSDSQITIRPYLNQPVLLYPKHSFIFTINCKPKFLGHSKELLIVLFRGFKLKRYIEVEIVDSTYDYDKSYDINAKIRKSKNELVTEMKNMRKNGNKNIIPGVRPIKPPHFIPVRLGTFPIPENIWNAVLGDSSQTIHSHEYDLIVNRIEEKLPCLTSGLNIQNYIDKWHTLLYMEEIQQNINMRAHDMPKTFLDRHQEYLCIEIKGLSEKRPSLIQGDQVLAKDIWDINAVEYEGFIHALKGNKVLMKFHPQFHENYSGSDVSLTFHSSRSVFRKCHQAINLALSNLGSDLLFPSSVQCRKPQISPEKIKNINWFNKNLNTGQKNAVLNILRGECRPMPYCIYGPPGTGKTITVVETILQILIFFPDSRILVATPSNSASNLITERLLKYRDAFSDSIIRLIAHYLTESENLPDVIKPFCATMDITKENTNMPIYHIKKNGINANCQTSFIGRHRVTIGTCCLLGSLAQMGLPRGHFTHVIIDEAGQATEPEIMIPMTFTDKENGQIILAGDPMQLGPVVMSKYCKEFGMDDSYLVRILERFPYQKDFTSFQEGYDRRLVTKLTDNYRSLEEVLTLPSQIFYDGSLVPKLCRSESWINKMSAAVSEIFSMPQEAGGIFVYGIRGQNARAEDSPSWFNPQEASMVALSVCKLYKKNINPDEIGVVAPYIAQIKHLRVVFDAMGLPQPKIGTVEEFQGQERPIIIISTVRSTDSYLASDQKHTLGFVKHPKRVNVALTRAQVAVILFCNPHILCTDPLWRKVILQAINENKYVGCNLPTEISNFKEIE